MYVLADAQYITQVNEVEYSIFLQFPGTFHFYCLSIDQSSICLIHCINCLLKARQTCADHSFADSAEK